MPLIRRARHRARTPFRRTAAATAFVTVAALAAVVPQQGAALANADPCRQPVVRDVMVSQGLPSYSQLARGKTALFKLFLSEPSSTTCSNVGSETTSITGGRLFVTRRGSTVSQQVQLDVTPEGALPEFSGYDVAPVTATPADPRFVVPGSLLTSNDPLHASSTFDVTFTAELNYVVRGKSGVVRTDRLTVTQRPGGGEIAATVSKPVKPLRLLVVPMGNPDVTTPEQFPDDADTEVAAGLAAAARQLPVPDGLGPLDSTAGLRWHRSAGMVDLGPHVEPDGLTGTRTVDYMPNGKFCGGGSSFDYIQKQLSQFKSAWNAENPGEPVDRVLGAVWRDVSRGAQTGDGSCAEGYAGLGGTVAWVRVLPATDAREGVTGSLATLELTHGFGGSVMGARQGASGPEAGPGFPHSFSATADGTARNRAYNVPERAFLGATENRSVMAYDLAPYDDYGTLYEKKDWDFVLCFLTTTSSLTPSQDCGSPVSAGPAVSAAGGSYVLAGSTDGTPAGTDAHTYFEEDMPREGVDPSSAYRLVQRDAAEAATGPSTGVRVVTAGSDHPDGGDHSHEAARVAFEVAVPQQTGAVAFELWKGEPGAAGAVRLYRRVLSGAPDILSTGTAPAPTAPARYTSDGTSSQPAVSPDGALVAFTSPSGVVVARSGSDAPRSNAVPGGQAAWHPEGGELAVVRDGEVFLVPVTVPTAGPPVLGTPRKVYGSRVATGTPEASHPSYAPDASELVLSVAGDLFAVNLRLLTPDAYPVLCPLDALVQGTSGASSGLACRRLTSAADAETAPAWSAGSDLIAYERAGAVWTLDPDSPSGSATRRLGSAQVHYGAPAWAGERLLAAGSLGVVSVSAPSYDGLVVLSPVPGDTWPAASGDGTRVLLERPDGTARDLFSLSVTQQAATATVSDDDPASLRMDLFVSCAGRADPLVVAARPSSVDEEAGEAQFDLRYDTARTCAEGQLLYRTTDGYSVDREHGAAVAGGGRPVSAVYVPKPNAELLQFDTIPVSGAATGASGSATAQIAWTLTSPTGTATALGVGTSVPDVLPPAGGWQPGTWTLTAVPDGDASAATVRVFRVLADRDGDGIPDSRDLRALFDCYPELAETKPENALADYDRDLLPSIVDPQPCVSAMNGSVVFNPETLNLGSSGNPITLTLTTQAADVRGTRLDEVAITQVGGHDAALPAYAVTARSASVLEAKFARQDFIEFFKARGLRGYVPVVLTVTRAGTVVRGFDAASPVYQPS